MTEINIQIWPIETLEEFHGFCRAALKAAEPHSPEVLEKEERSFRPNLFMLIDQDPNRSQEMCYPDQVLQLFFCCWNRILDFDLSIVAARNIPYYYRKDGHMLNMLTDVARERLEYRRWNFGEDFDGATMREIIGTKLQDLWSFPSSRKIQSNSVLTEILQRHACLSDEVLNSLRQRRNSS